MQYHQDLMKYLHWAGKIKQPPAKCCPFGPKTKRILIAFKKIMRFFDQNLFGK